MKSRSQELLDRAVAAMLAAIEVYNKPNFPYRAESFAALAVNAWELLLKAKWLVEHQNDVSCLYVRQQPRRADKPLRKPRVKKSRSGNPMTHGADYLAKKLLERGILDQAAGKNLEALIELRDSVVHFYNPSPLFAQRLQELGAASVKNFTSAIADWFRRDLGGFKFFLMPLSFVELPDTTEVVVLNPHEKRFLAFLNSLEPKTSDPASRYAVTVNIELRFTKSKAKDALPVQVTDDPNAPAVQLTEEDTRKRYPWNYEKLNEECKKRYEGFKINAEYHALRRALLKDKRYCYVRELDPGNPKSAKKPFFSPNILREFDKHFTRKT
ncbi:MAG: DUF3644 domain-containing protein [Cyclobacteriaceae bacterium]|nr:DUF3644 domain-containing protein [Cyclobacteriaceae bacterium]